MIRREHLSRWRKALLQAQEHADPRGSESEIDAQLMNGLSVVSQPLNGKFDNAVQLPNVKVGGRYLPVHHQPQLGFVRETESGLCLQSTRCLVDSSVNPAPG